MGQRIERVWFLWMGVVVSAIWFCLAVYDWLMEYTSGFYYEHQLEWFLETTLLMAYMIFAIRFLTTRINL